MSAIRVTALVTVHKAEKYLRACLEDLVTQSLGDALEILVLDSASPENEGDIVREFSGRHPHLTYFRTDEREGTSEAFNRMISGARGEYLTNANADDGHHPEALERLADVLDRYEDRGIVYADSVITETANERFLETGARLRFDWPDYTHGAALSCCLFGPHPMWRRKAHILCGGFDPALRIANDQDMFLRIALRYGAVHLRETLGLFLCREDSNSGSRHREATLREVRGVLARFRRQTPLELLFPALAGDGDAEARAAAWIELGNLCALGPYNDPALALQFYSRAGEEPWQGSTPSASFRRGIANNAACALAVLGLHDRAERTLGLAEGCGAAEHNGVRLAAGRVQDARELAFWEPGHPVVQAARTTRGLVRTSCGEWEWSEPHEQRPWDVYDGPDGVPFEHQHEQSVGDAETRAEEIVITTPIRRVLLVMYGWAESGGGTMLPRQVAKAYVRRGLEVTVFYARVERVPELGPYCVIEAEEDGVRLVGLGNRPSDFLDLGAPDREIEDPRVSAIFGELLDDVGPDVVHFYNLHNLGLALPRQCKERGIPTILSSNNYWPICPHLYLIERAGGLCTGGIDDPGRCVRCIGGSEDAAPYARRAREALRCLNEDLDRHLAVSRRVREIFVDNGVRPDRIEVVWQQPEQLDRLWAEIGAHRPIAECRQGPLRVAFIGSLLAHKGPQVLVRAVQALPRGSIEVTLHGDGDRSFGQALLDLDRQQAITFGGRYSLDELPSRLKAADIVVVPSIWEDCAPYVVAEALAARVPVIASRIGGIPDYVVDGQNGYLFPAGDAEALSVLLVRLVEEEGLLGRLQAAIRPPRGFEAYLNELLGIYGELGRRPAALSSAGVEVPIAPA